jgi:hypothetical protein
MKTMKNVLTSRLKSLPSKKLKRIIRQKKRKYLIVNDFNPNDIFEVEAHDSNNAAHAALAQLGWWMAEDS